MSEMCPTDRIVSSSTVYKAKPRSASWASKPAAENGAGLVEQLNRPAISKPFGRPAAVLNRRLNSPTDRQEMFRLTRLGS